MPGARFFLGVGCLAGANGGELRSWGYLKSLHNRELRSYPQVSKHILVVGVSLGSFRVFRVLLLLVLAQATYERLGCCELFAKASLDFKTCPKRDNTVDASEIWRSPVEVGSLSHYLQGFIHSSGAGFLPSYPVF